MKTFFQQNKVLSALLLLSIWAIFKFSEIPYPFEFLSALDWFLLKPSVESWTYELFKLIENLSLAYIASLMFYVIVDYRPKEKMKQRAYTVIKDDLINLYLYMGDIISSFIYILKIDKPYDNITIDDAVTINAFQVTDSIVNYKTINFIDGVEKGVCTECFNPYEDFYKYGKLIKDLLDKFDKLPCLTYLDFDLLERLSAIQSSAFLRHLLSIRDNIFIAKKIFVENMNLNQDFVEFIKYWQSLNVYNFTKHTSKKIDISEQEVSENLIEQAKTIQNNPELLKILIALNEQQD